MTNTCIFGDCREGLRKIKESGVTAQMCVTSPPYYGLRDYGVDGQIGMEETPESYISNLVEVFQGVREVLADDGTLWVNIGDSYCGSNSGGIEDNKAAQHGTGATALGKDRPTKKIPGIKPKDLIGTPWMLAFALRADGWYLRQDIIWHKPNPMPESVTDRCTKAHEYIFLLSKRQTYYFNHKAIMEAAAYDGRNDTKYKGGDKDMACSAHERWTKNDAGEYMRNKRSVWDIPTQPYSGAHFAVFPPDLIKPCILAGSKVGDVVLDPFFGSGTTGEVCEQLGRQWIGCELNPEYEKLQKERTRQRGLRL